MLAMLWAATLGCATTGLRVPGPLGSLGREPMDYEPRTWESPPTGDDEPSTSPRGGLGERVARAAEGMVGETRLRVQGESFRADCSGFVMAAHAAAGVTLEGNTASFFQQAQEARLVRARGPLQPGDVVFWDDTYDRNDNGRRDDELSHVGIVTEALDDGTAVIVHYGSRGVARTHMNLRHPGERSSPNGEAWNDPLRSGKDDGGPVLTGELFRGHAAMWSAAGASVADGET